MDDFYTVKSDLLLLEPKLKEYVNARHQCPTSFGEYLNRDNQPADHRRLIELADDYVLTSHADTCYVVAKFVGDGKVDNVVFS